MFRNILVEADPVVKNSRVSPDKDDTVADAPSRRKSSKLDIVKSTNCLGNKHSRSDSHTVHSLALSFSTLVTPTSEHESK